MAANISKTIFPVLLLLISFLFKGSGHPFYLSVCDLKYNNQEMLIQGSVKIFVNDLELAIKNKTGKRTDLINVKDSVETQAVLAAYLDSKLQFFLDGKPLKYKLLGFELEQEALWIYLESDKCRPLRSFKIKNAILCELLPQQMNIVHFSYNNKMQSNKVNCPDSEMSFQF